jgi:hypothetical protein
MQPCNTYLCFGCLVLNLNVFNVYYYVSLLRRLFYGTGKVTRDLTCDVPRDLVRDLTRDTW